MTEIQLILLSIIICNMITLYELFKTFYEVKDLKNEIEKIKRSLDNEE